MYNGSYRNRMARERVLGLQLKSRELDVDAEGDSGLDGDGG